jgi:hypothetical protein
MIDFPASPAVGQQFTAGNGVIYEWNGTLWMVRTDTRTNAPVAFKVRATGGGFSMGGPNYTSVFRAEVSDSVDYDSHGALGSNATGRAFTAPSDGIYHFDGQCYFGGQGCQVFLVLALVSSGGIIQLLADGGGIATPQGNAFTVSGDFRMTAGQQAALFWSNESGAAAAQIMSAGLTGLGGVSLAWFSGHKVSN